VSLGVAFSPNPGIAGIDSRLAAKALIGKALHIEITTQRDAASLCTSLGKLPDLLRP
jgi:hypothetical protein